jgi:SpoVK/Ycf46/Vps4 family AAA+-type ATPase
MHMDLDHDLWLQGFPENIPEHIAAVYRSRLLTTVKELLNKAKLKEAKITIGTASQMQNTDTPASMAGGQPGKSKESDDTPVEERARQYTAQKPRFRSEQLVLPNTVKENLLSAVTVIQVESLVFDTWGLRAFEPFPRTALNFHGPPGTGKTLAAHAIAHQLGRPILAASYAEIESKFHGDGPKNVKAIFYAAERDGAVLFIDEADSLLSKRLTNVTQGSEQAINSMRSQLLICLEQFRGVVIFATNLVKNYDKAFETRVRHIYFPLPDEKGRCEIWRKHLPPQLPLAPDVTPESLAHIERICGRDIKNAVIDAAVRAAIHRKAYIERSDLIEAIERIKAARVTEEAEVSRELTAEEKEEMARKISTRLLREHKQEIKGSGTSANGNTPSIGVIEQ